MAYHFPQSTRGVHVPGVGTTITRANIAAVQSARIKGNKAPLDSEQIVRTFGDGLWDQVESKLLPGRLLNRATSVIRRLARVQY